MSVRCFYFLDRCIKWITGNEEFISLIDYCSLVQQDFFYE